MARKLIIRIATRKSPLALWQANYVKGLLGQSHPELDVRFVELVTEGDRSLDVPIATLGGKSLFVKELQRALLNHEADIAVHCVKDLPVLPHQELSIVAVCHREHAHDVFLSNHYPDPYSLPPQAVVGTSSPRRQSYLKAMRPDIEICLLRGNIGTRVKKLDSNDYDAIVLAYAGLKRLGMEGRVTYHFDPKDFIPAIGQGALCIECRSDDNTISDLIKPLDHYITRRCITAERAFNVKLCGDCYTPLAAYATLEADKLSIRGMVGSTDGKQILTAQISGSLAIPEELGILLAENLLAQGAASLLN